MLVCDFAQYYGCFDWRSLPVKTAAVLCTGLPPESRVMIKLSGAKVPYNTLLLASILDQVNVIRWLNTRDGAKGTNRPKSILATLTDSGEAETALFDTGEEFMQAYRKAVEKCRL